MEAGYEEMLQSKEVAVRADGVRGIAQTPSVQGLDLLVSLVQSERSAAVAMVAADAATQMAITLRRQNAGTIPEGWSGKLAKAAFASDPVRNPTQLQLASFDSSRANLGRLRRALRDTRSDVRRGALEALRYLLGSAFTDRGAVARAMQPWFKESGWAPETLRHMASLLADAGAVEVARACGHLTHEGNDVLARLESSEGFDGVWVGTGHDLYERGHGAPKGWACTTAGRIISATGSRDIAPVVDGVSLRVLHRVDVESEGEAQMLYEGHVLRPLKQDELLYFMGHYGEAAADHPEAGAALAALAEGMTDQRTLTKLEPLLIWVQGDPAGSLARWDELLDGARPLSEFWFWRGLVRHQQGDAEGAREDLEVFVGKAKRKADWRDHAQELLDAWG